MEAFGNSLDALAGLNKNSSKGIINKSYSKNTSKKPSAFMRKVPSQPKNNIATIYSPGESGQYIEFNIIDESAVVGSSKYEIGLIERRKIDELRKDSVDKRYGKVLDSLEKVFSRKGNKKKSLDDLLELRKNSSSGGILLGAYVNSEGELDVLDLKEKEGNNEYVRLMQKPVERKYLMLDEKDSNKKANFVNGIQSEYSRVSNLIVDLMSKNGKRIPSLNTEAGQKRRRYIQEMKKIEVDAKMNGVSLE